MEATSTLTPVAEAARARRRARAIELDDVQRAVTSGSWAGRHHRSPTMWLSSQTGESPGHCSVTVQLASRLQEMPIVKACFADGVLAESALRLLADAWHPHIADTFARDEQLLVDWALRLCHRDFKLVLERWRLIADAGHDDRSTQERFESRRLHVSELLDGMGRLDGLLAPEGLLLVREAISALARKAGADDLRRPEQRRADALVTMAKIAITASQRSGLLPDLPGGRRNQPTVIATIAWDDLAAGTGVGTLDTTTGTAVVTTDTIRRLCCDAGIHRLVQAADGTTLDFGRRTRSISDSLWNQLVVRDHGCRLGDCPTGPAGCDAHHSIHWADDGRTELDTLVLACWYHHHWLHEQHWSIEPLGAGHFILRDPDGNTHPMRPPMVGHAPVPLALPA
jgi:hypothetical protein